MLNKLTVKSRKYLNLFPGYKSIRSSLDFLLGSSQSELKWSRVVMQQETAKLVESLHPSQLKVLEISGDYWHKFKFKEYKSLHYPQFDICESTIPESFNLIIADQVFEHLLYPYKAGTNVYQMLNDNGYFLISTPFLVRVHNYPIDCTRWTETGLKYFLAECGFDLAKIQTWSWGNRKCIRANFDRWEIYRPILLHSLKNEPDFPYHVWALAQK